jgi:hypothetical protein
LADINGQRRYRYAGTSSIPVDDHSFEEQGSGVHGAKGTALTPDAS